MGIESIELHLGFLVLCLLEHMAPEVSDLLCAEVELVAGVRATKFPRQHPRHHLLDVGTLHKLWRLHDIVGVWNALATCLHSADSHGVADGVDSIATLCCCFVQSEFPRENLVD